jgi:hypothetical protein
VAPVSRDGHATTNESGARAEFGLTGMFSSGANLRRTVAALRGQIG